MSIKAEPFDAVLRPWGHSIVVLIPKNTREWLKAHGQPVPGAGVKVTLEV